MIIDTSAIMAILLNEPEREPFTKAIGRAPRRLFSAGSWVELAAVLTRGPGRVLDPAYVSRLIQSLGFEIVPVTVEQAAVGHAAYREYGLGTAHPAHLNFGDCFAYALAKATGEPLLFKGDDFSETDIVSAL